MARSGPTPKRRSRGGRGRGGRGGRGARGGQGRRASVKKRPAAMMDDVDRAFDLPPPDGQTTVTAALHGSVEKAVPKKRARAKEVACPPPPSSEQPEPQSS